MFSTGVRSVIFAVLLTATPVLRPADAEPYRPSDEAEVVAELPKLEEEVLQPLADEREGLRSNPRNLQLALRLARRYAALGRREADPRYEGYAQAALAPWWQLEHPPLPVRLMRAHLNQRRHDFVLARAELEAVLADHPENSQAWLSKAMIEATQGRPHQAAMACRHLDDARLPLVAAGCKGHAGRLLGNAASSYRLLQDALDRSPAASAEIRLWILTIMAEISMQLDWPKQAEQHLDNGRRLDPGDPYLLGLYADLLLDQERLIEARDLLQTQAMSDPLLLRLAIAEHRLGEPPATDHINLLRARFDAARRRGDTLHLREQSRFALVLEDKPGKALDLAIRNWSTQRERTDARLLLEAAIASGRPGAAQPVVAWLSDTRIEDAVLQVLAGRMH
jgi:hypothetical protein